MQGRSVVQSPLPPGWSPRWQYRTTIGRGPGKPTTAHPLATRLVCHPRHRPRPRPRACRRPGTCTLHIHIAAHQHSPAARGHARTRQAAAGRVPAAGSGRAAACRQVWTHADWRTPQRPPRGASSGARRGAGLSQRHRALAGIWPCEFPFPQLGSRNFGLGSISRTVEPCSTRVFDGLPAQTIWIKFHPETSEFLCGSLQPLPLRRSGWRARARHSKTTTTSS